MRRSKFARMCNDRAKEALFRNPFEAAWLSNVAYILEAVDEGQSFDEIADLTATLFSMTALVMESYDLDPEVREKLKRCILPGEREAYLNATQTWGWPKDKVMEALQFDPETLAAARKMWSN